MAAISIDLADDLRSRLQARARESGFENIEDYVEAMLLADVSGPEISDEKIEGLLLERVDGPFVEVDEADFRQMKHKLEERLRGMGGHDTKAGL